jgi:hypothetical protein
MIKHTYIPGIRIAKVTGGDGINSSKIDDFLLMKHVFYLTSVIGGECRGGIRNAPSPPIIIILFFVNSAKKNLPCPSFLCIAFFTVIYSAGN